MFCINSFIVYVHFTFKDQDGVFSALNTAVCVTRFDDIIDSGSVSKKLQCYCCNIIATLYFFHGVQTRNTRWRCSPESSEPACVEGRKSVFAKAMFTC